MALYTVVFTERGGYRVQCRIRAAGQTPFEVIGLAVRKVWGDEAGWVPTTPSRGRVWASVADDIQVPKTAETEVTVEPVTRRRRVA